MNTEKYVKCNLSRKERSVLAQIRLGILPLKIETGRFENLLPENRLCEFCSNQTIEDEEHFLFKCELNRELRMKFMYTLQNRSTETISNESSSIILWKTLFENPRQSSRYIISAFENRRNHLYVSHKFNYIVQMF